jgi:hypothetical protein
MITAPINIAALGANLQQNQLVDYRPRRSASIHYLAQALAGAHNNVNPTLPDDFRRSRGPYPIRLMGRGLRLLGALHLILGASALIVAHLAPVSRLSSPLAIFSLALGFWCFWEAEPCRCGAPHWRCCC